MKKIWIAVLITLSVHVQAQVDQKIPAQTNVVSQNKSETVAPDLVGQGMVLDNGEVLLLAKSEGHLVSIEVKKLKAASLPLYVYNSANVLYTTFMVRPKVRITTLLPKGTYLLATGVSRKIKSTLIVR